MQSNNDNNNYVTNNPLLDMDRETLRQFLLTHGISSLVAVAGVGASSSSEQERTGSTTASTQLAGATSDQQMHRFSLDSFDVQQQQFGRTSFGGNDPLSLHHHSHHHDQQVLDHHSSSHQLHQQPRINQQEDILVGNTAATSFAARQGTISRTPPGALGGSGSSTSRTTGARRTAESQGVTSGRLSQQHNELLSRLLGLNHQPMLQTSSASSIPTTNSGTPAPLPWSSQISWENPTLPRREPTASSSPSTVPNFLAGIGASNTGRGTLVPSSFALSPPPQFSNNRLHQQQRQGEEQDGRSAAPLQQAGEQVPQQELLGDTVTGGGMHDSVVSPSSSRLSLLLAQQEEVQSKTLLAATSSTTDARLLWGGPQANDSLSKIVLQGGDAAADVSIVPCRARGMPRDHNIQTAYFVMHKNLKHGDGLQCSHPQCRSRGIRFVYCQVCGIPVAKINFTTRHSHPRELRAGGLASTEGNGKKKLTMSTSPSFFSMPPNKNKRPLMDSDNDLGGSMTEDHQHSRDLEPVKSKRSRVSREQVERTTHDTTRFELVSVLLDQRPETNDFDNMRKWLVDVILTTDTPTRRAGDSSTSTSAEADLSSEEHVKYVQDLASESLVQVQVQEEGHCENGGEEEGSSTTEEDHHEDDEQDELR